MGLVFGYQFPIDYWLRALNTESDLRETYHVVNGALGSVLDAQSAGGVPDGTTTRPGSEAPAIVGSGLGQSVAANGCRSAG